MKKASIDGRTGVKQEFYEYIDDNSFQRVGVMTVANVRTVSQTTSPSGGWVEAVSVTTTGFNCSQRREGPLQPPLSSSVVQHNVDGTVTDITSVAKAQFASTKLGLTRNAGPDDKDFAYACSHKW